MITKVEIYEGLYYKQRNQLKSLCEEFQPYTNTETVVFLEVVKAAREFCWSMRQYSLMRNKKDNGFEELMIGRSIEGIKNKFYFNGIKYSKRSLTSRGYDIISQEQPQINLCGTYKPEEKELYMKVVRACRDFMRAKMSKEAELEFYEKLEVVRKAMKEY